MPTPTPAHSATQPIFIPGLELAELLFVEAAQPILAAHFPALRYSAARLDFGSDVLGFDTPQSMDHGWGPKLTLFVSEADLPAVADSITHTLANELPFTIHGIPTHFVGEGGEATIHATAERPIRHGVRVTTPAQFFREYTGFDATQPLLQTDWLAIAPQRLRTIASGRVFHDGLGELEPARRQLAWYPRDVWLYLMANQWRRIDQDEPFMARCGDVGDELGSRLIAARLVHELMSLCFLIERHYPPYTKWFGTAFGRLACASHLTPVFHRILDSATWREREQYLSVAYLVVMDMHNGLGVTPFIKPDITPFYSRPYVVPHAGRFVDALHGAIQSSIVRALPPYTGAVWQFSDSTDVLESVEQCRILSASITDSRLPTPDS